jgi:hypothetical protein
MLFNGESGWQIVLWFYLFSLGLSFSLFCLICLHLQVANLAVLILNTNFIVHDGEGTGLSDGRCKVKSACYRSSCTRYNHLPLFCCHFEKILPGQLHWIRMIG